RNPPAGTKARPKKLRRTPRFFVLVFVHAGRAMQPNGGPRGKPHDKAKPVARRGRKAYGPLPSTRDQRRAGAHHRRGSRPPASGQRAIREAAGLPKGIERMFPLTKKCAPAVFAVCLLLGTGPKALAQYDRKNAIVEAVDRVKDGIITLK